jgi:hypothetical protein
MSTPGSGLLLALALPFLAWEVYRRYRRIVGRQLLRRGRVTIGLVIFILVALFLLVRCMSMPRMLAGLCGGLALGGLLALVGLRLTKFDIGGDRPSYYTPNTYIGEASTLLLVGRLLYRMGAVYFADGAIAEAAPSLMQILVTMGLAGLTVGYYIAYNSGVLIRSRR